MPEEIETAPFKQIRLFKLHGSMKQKDRLEVFKKFRGADSDGGILLCTDVAARGLDLPQVDWIVQVSIKFKLSGCFFSKSYSM